MPRTKGAVNKEKTTRTPRAPRTRRTEIVTREEPSTLVKVGRVVAVGMGAVLAMSLVTSLLARRAPEPVEYVPELEPRKKEKQEDEPQNIYCLGLNGRRIPLTEWSQGFALHVGKLQQEAHAEHEELVGLVNALTDRVKSLEAGE